MNYRESSDNVSARGRGSTAIALALTLLAVEVVVLAESWRGLTGFAHLIGVVGPAAWGVPVTLDGVSLVAALVALRAELAGEASGLYRVTLLAFTSASATANYWHGRTTGGIPAALYFGGMSIAVALVFSLALRQIRHQDRRAAGAVTARLPRFSAAHWARYPRLTWRAWSLAVRDGHTTAHAALAAAACATSPASVLSHEPAALVHPGRPDVASLVASSRRATGNQPRLSHAQVRRTEPGPSPQGRATGEAAALSQDRLSDVTAVSQADAIRHAIRQVGVKPGQVVAWLAENGRSGVAPQRVCDVLRRDQKARQRASALHTLNSRENVS